MKPAAALVACHALSILRLNWRTPALGKSNQKILVEWLLRMLGA